MPKVNWERTGREVLTTEWIDGTPIADVESLRAQGFDLVKLGDTVIQSFLRHAIRDGFFHADMHQGNLFVDRSGNLVAVDFGIVGRLGPKESMFLAEILYGFITRNYLRVSEVHFEAGYVPRHHDPAVFAQAHPLDRRADHGPARQPDFHGAAADPAVRNHRAVRHADPAAAAAAAEDHGGGRGRGPHANPDLNMWVTAEPVVGGWIKRQLGPAGKLEEAAGSIRASSLPAFPPCWKMPSAPPTMLSDMAATGGLRLDRETTEHLALSQARHARWTRFWLALGAISLAAIAIKLDHLRAVGRLAAFAAIMGS